MGYMLDGFGIYGPFGENRELPKSAGLYECPGHTQPVIWDGQLVNIYLWACDFLYNIACYNGTP